MRLSIRWKFILSIGLTLLVTYLALLAWDYRWQQETAVLQMQDLVTTRAHGLATGMNDRLRAALNQADALATAIQSAAPTNEDQLLQVIRQARPSGNFFFIRQLDPSSADSRPVVLSFHITTEQPGQRGGRGVGRRGRGASGAEPPGERDGPPAREGQAPRRGRQGGGRGPVANVARAEQAQNSELVSFLNRSVQPEWSPPQGDSNFESGVISTYSIPIVFNELARGVLVTVVNLDELEQFRPPNRGRGRGPASAPATQPSTATEAVSLLDSEARRIWPPRPPQQRAESTIAQAEALGLTNVVENLRDSIAGEARVVDVKDMPSLVPGSVPGTSYWVALSPIATTDWVVAAAIPESQFMNRIVNRLWQRGLFLMAGLALLLLITAIVSIRITQPIAQMAGAVKELAAGNLDAQVTGVNSRDELGQLAGAFNTMTRQLKQHVADLTEQTAARQSVEAELRIARQIQSDLLPQKFPPFPDRKEFELHAVNVAAKRVAGDFYDFFFGPNDLLTVAIADVSGKGMPAALLMAVTRTIIRNLALEGMSPGQIVERANTMLLQDITNSMFVTLFLCQYDPRTGRIVYVNAGHPHPYTFGNNGSPKQFGEVTGAILGVSPNGSDWTFEEREAHLQVGETLLLYTDGVTEARAPDDSMLREVGLESLIAKYGDESVETICAKFVEEVDRFQHGHQSDDITLLALRRKF